MLRILRSGFLVTGALCGLLSAACSGEDGQSCTVTQNTDGTATITCEDGTSATVSNGTDGTDGDDGTSCTITDNGDGTKTIACEDGTSAVVRDGEDGQGCTVFDPGDGTKIIACGDTSITVSDGAAGAGCAVSDNGDGSSTVACGATSTTIANGTTCTVTDNGDRTLTLACDDGTSVTWYDNYLACTLGFDDAYAVHGDGASPEAFYGAHGVHFDNSAGYGLIGGVGNGDPGNWNIEGTNGSAAWGLWSGPHSISFDVPTEGVTVDFLRGYQDVGATSVVASLRGVVVQTMTMSLDGEPDYDRVTFDVQLDKIEWSNPFVVGLDNVHYTAFACP